MIGYDLTSTPAGVAGTVLSHQPSLPYTKTKPITVAEPTAAATPAVSAPPTPGAQRTVAVPGATGTPAVPGVSGTPEAKATYAPLGTATIVAALGAVGFLFVMRRKA